MRILKLILILSVTIFARAYKPKLDRGEHLFAPSTSYRMQNFNLAWSVSYFKVLSYNTIYDNPKKVDYKSARTLFKTDNRKLNPNSVRYLMKVMLRSNYFWKYRLAPSPMIRYNIVIFIDKHGKMFALESKKELREFLGKIDTPAELLLWTYANDKGEFGNPYSYKKIKNGYRVRYNTFVMQSCDYVDEFIYYNRYGKVIKRVRNRVVHDRHCTPTFL